MLIGTLPAYATVTDVNIIPSPPPAAPTDVAVSAISDTTAQVSWPAVTSAQQYTVYLNGQVYSGSNSPKTSLEGLTPNTTYDLYVVANNTGGNSAPSTTVNFTTLSPVPIVPSGPAITTTSTSAELIWHPLADNYNIIEYIIYLDGQINKIVEPQKGMQTTTLNDLIIGDHTVTISATNDNNEGPQSQPVTFTITTVPAPMEIQVYNKSADTAWLSWQPVPGVSSYNLYLNSQQIGETYEPSYILKSLNPDTAYEISVVSVMPDGQQSSDTYVTVQTDPLPDVMSALSLTNKIFTYLPDVKIYFEILFALFAVILLSHSLKLSLKR